MKMCSIASGSSGNCIYIGTEATHLLVDVGISCKKTVEGLNQLGLKGQDIDGILITHEHADHINGLGVMSRKFGIPICPPSYQTHHGFSHTYMQPESVSFPRSCLQEAAYQSVIPDCPRRMVRRFPVILPD